MKFYLSSFLLGDRPEELRRLMSDNIEIAYIPNAGYSAALCVLAPGLEALQIVDDPDDKPYVEGNETIWEGLGFLDYMILPHYKSDHPESDDIDKEIDFCRKSGIPFKTLSDGDVIIIE